MEINFLDDKHRQIYLEVDRLYHKLTTDDGRCILIADYIMRLLNEREAEPEPDGWVCRTCGMYYESYIEYCLRCGSDKAVISQSRTFELFENPE